MRLVQGTCKREQKVLFGFGKFQVIRREPNLEPFQYLVSLFCIAINIAKSKINYTLHLCVTVYAV